MIVGVKTSKQTKIKAKNTVRLSEEGTPNKIGLLCSTKYLQSLGNDAT